MKRDRVQDGDITEYVSIPKRVSEALKLHSLTRSPLHKPSLLVSIPKRVSEALKPLRNGFSIVVYSCYVSIPKRVSEALKRDAFKDFCLMAKFQSLKGFQRL